MLIIKCIWFTVVDYCYAHARLIFTHANMCACSLHWILLIIRVEDVEVDTIEPLENNKLAVKGRCSTVYGDIAIDEEVNLNNES